MFDFTNVATGERVASYRQSEADGSKAARSSQGGHYCHESPEHPEVHSMLEMPIILHSD